MSAMLFVLPFSISLIEISFTCMLVFWIAKRAMDYKRQTSLVKVFQPMKSELNLPIAAFIIIALLSALNSVSLGLSFKGFFLKLIEGALIYFITIETIADESKLNGILRVLFLSMTLIGADAIFQLITGMDFIRQFSASRMIRGSFGTPNGFGGWLLIMIFLALSLSCSRKNIWLVDFSEHSRFERTLRIVSWFLTGLLIVCLVLTYSRGAWMAVVLALIFMGVLKGKKLFVIITVIPVIVFFIFQYAIKGTLSWGVRVCLWREALQMIEDFPLLGTGINTYAHIGSRYAIPGGGGVYPHNCYLQMAAETGLLGLGAFAWMVIVLFKTSVANLKMINDSFYKTLLTGMLTGLFGFFAHSFVDTNIYTRQLGTLMWVMMGLIVAVQKIALTNIQQHEV